MRLLKYLLFSFLLVGTCYADDFNNGGIFNKGLFIRTSDSTVQVKVKTLIVPSGSLTDNGDGSAYLATSSSGGSSDSGWTDDGTVVRLRTASDNVGIGTTAPGNSLSITKSGGLSIFDVTSYNVSTSNRAILFFRTATGTEASPGDVANGNNLGEFIGSGYAGGAFRNVAAMNFSVDSGTISSSSLPSYIYFETTPAGSVTRTERMRITSAGSVGIGVTAPTNKLHIAGANDDGELISGNGAGNWAALIVENTSGTVPQAFLRTEGSSIGTNFFGVTRNNAAELFVQNNSSFIIGNLGNTPLIFGNNNTERMRLAAGGNVGIGTTNPRSKLELAGTMIISSGGANAGTIGVGTSTPTASIQVRAGSAAASSAPLKLTSGTKMTTAEDGAMEYNGDFLISPQADKRVSICGLYNDNITQVDLLGTTSETDLTSTTLPANFFNKDGQKIVGDYIVSFGAAAGVTDRVRLYYDGNVIFDSTANAYTSGGAMFIHVDMVATQGVDHMNIGVSVTGSGIATTTWVTYNDFSSQSFASAPKVIKVTGQLSSTLSGQISLNHSQLMYCGPN